MQQNSFKPKKQPDSLETGDNAGLNSRIEQLCSALYTLDSSVAGRIRAFKLIWSLSEFLPRTTFKSAECQQTVRFISNFSEITFEDTINSALLFAIDPQNGQTIVEPGKIQISDKETAKITFKKNGHFEKLFEESTYRLPMAICLGCDQFITFASKYSSAPKFINKLAIAGFLRQKPVLLKNCLSQKVNVPVDADVVIEGYVQKSDGVFHISCTSHRKDIVLPLKWFRP